MRARQATATPTPARAVDARSGGVGNALRATGKSDLSSSAAGDLAALGEGWGEEDASDGEATSVPTSGEVSTADTPPAEGSEDAGGTEGEAPAALSLTVENEQANPAGAKARTTVGIGEVSFFTPSGEGGTWTTTSGSGGAEADGVYRWVAPTTAGSATITWTLGEQSTSMTMTVVAPTTVTGTKTGETGQTPGVHGSGMTLSLVIGPTTVSFANMEWMEEQGAIGSSGIFAGRELPIQHNPDWSFIGGSNQISDRADHRNFPRPWDAGTMTYTIAQKYRVGSTEGTIANVDQVHTMTGTDGTSSTSKAGATSAARKP